MVLRDVPGGPRQTSISGLLAAESEHDDSPAAFAGQGEWQTRVQPAAAGQMAAEMARCEHALLRTGRAIRIGAGP